METQKLYKTRVLPAFDKMYRASKCGIPELKDVVFGWDDIVKYSVVADEPFSYGRKDVTMIPFMSFFLDHEMYNKILNEASKGLRSHWTWSVKSQIHEKKYTIEEALAVKPKAEDFTNQSELDQAIWTWRREYDDPLFDQYQKSWHALDDNLKAGKIDRKAYNKEMDALAKTYGMTKRSRDAEYVRVNLALTCSPNSNNETYTKPWNEVKDFKSGMTFQEVYEKTKSMDAASIYCFYWNWKKEH